MAEALKLKLIVLNDSAQFFRNTVLVNNLFTGDSQQILCVN